MKGELWKEALGNSREGYDAYEQLAIHYEHKACDPEQARRIMAGNTTRRSVVDREATCTFDPCRLSFRPHAAYIRAIHQGLKWLPRKSSTRTQVARTASAL